MKRFIWVFAVLGVVFLTWGISLNNKGNRLKAHLESFDKDLESTHDKVRKEINGISSVQKIEADQYEKYLAAYVEGSEAIGSGEGWLWVQDNIAQNNNQILQDLSRVIQNGTKEFKAANDRINHAYTAYNVWASQFPQSVFYNTVEIKQITSTKSKEAFESGKDDSPLISE